MKICGETMLERVVKRSRRAEYLDLVVVATSTLPQDDAIVSDAARYDSPVFRGNERDVLDRYYRACKEFSADIVIRLTSDCPLIEPEIIDLVINRFTQSRVDYASNVIPPSFPRGLDVEVMTAHALACAWEQAKKPFERIHVTPYIYDHPESFHLLSVSAKENYSHYRWTVDTSEDLTFVRLLYEKLGKSNLVSWREVLTLLAQHPEIADLNKHIRQKALEEG